MKLFKILLVFASSLLFAQPTANDSAPALSRFQAHAHNDYLHNRPLYDALSHGFRSIEIDVWLINDSLYVAHERNEVVRSPEFTIEQLYLNPLAALIRKNPENYQLTVMIDVKSDADSAYRKLDDLLPHYGDIVTLYTPGRVYEKALHVVISGNRSRQLMLADSTRWATYDGRMEDLESDVSASFMWMVSDKWGDYFDWQGNGEIPKEQFDKLMKITRSATDRQRKIRFWATPDGNADLFSRENREKVWRLLAKAGCIIATDDLQGLRDFLRK